MCPPDIQSILPSLAGCCIVFFGICNIRRRKKPQGKPLGWDTGAGRSGWEQEAAVLQPEGLKQEPALGKGNFPMTPWREKQRENGAGDKRSSGKGGRAQPPGCAGWFRGPCSYQGSSAEPLNPSSSTFPCGFCC